MEQSVPAVAGAQETTECSAGVGSTYMRIYKKENVQILVIFVKLSVVPFQQEWLCSHKEVIFPSFSQAMRHPALALALPGTG